MSDTSTHPGASTLKWPKWALDLVAAPMQASRPMVVAMVGGMVAAFTILTYVAGGTSSIPPHWFYLPIVVAGARFGVVGGLTTAIVSGLAVGPLMPADVAAGTLQATSDWTIRTLFFAGVGLAVTALMRQAARGIIRERRHLASTRRLQRALQQKQLHLHFQPIVSAATGVMTGAEALLRWEAPEDGLLEPDEFVPAAERTGQIVPIGSWVLEEACAQLSAWSSEIDDTPLVMSVNVSAAQLRQGDIVGDVLTILRRHSLDPSSLCLEITESSLVPEQGRSIETLAALRQLGVSIAIDDFGRGLSSLAYLRSIPYDTIKIDGRFLEELGRHRDADTLVDSIARLAKDLDKTTVAEKVETDLQWHKVVQSGCTHGQGYLFAPPLPPAAFVSLLASRQTWPADEFKVSGL